MKQLNYKVGVKILIGLGIFIRLYQYLVCRSLYHDEALLARNINDLSFPELTSVLEFNQAAPFGFLWLTKAIVNVAGDQEYSFRLIPLLAGIASILVFYKIIQYFFNSSFRLIALAFFILNNHLVFYSISFKQYGIDVFIGLLITWAFLKVLNEEHTQKEFFVWTFIGASLVYFSQPSIFFLASGGLVLTFSFLGKKNFPQFKNLTLSGSIWIASFLFYFFFFLRPNLSNDFLQNYHTQYYMPLSFWKAESWSWYIDSFTNLFSNPTDIHFKTLGVIFGFLGIIFGLLKNDKKYFLLLLPILFAFGASAFEKYSTIPRLMLFATPAFIIFLVEGLEFVYQKLDPIIPKFSFPITLILFGILLLQSFLNSAIHQIAKPKRVENIKALLSYIESEKQPNDVLYLYFHSEAQFGYYKNKYDLTNLEIIQGKNPYDELWESDFETLKNKGRIWVLMTHYKRLDGTLDNQIYTKKMNTFCLKTAEKNEAGGVVLLYNCSSK